MAMRPQAWSSPIASASSAAMAAAVSASVVARRLPVSLGLSA